eukprot:8805043-Pyramimonas_sp.AAC.1
MRIYPRFLRLIGPIGPTRQEEELRPYFALPAVMDGMFALAQRIFQITVVPADGEAPVWHPDVR